MDELRDEITTLPFSHNRGLGEAVTGIQKVLKGRVGSSKAKKLNKG